MSETNESLDDLTAAQAAEYFAMHRSKSTPELDREFLEWLRASPLHVARYLQIAALSRELAQAAKRIDTPLATLIEQANGTADVVTLAQSRAVRTENYAGRGVAFRAWSAVAAAAIVMMIAAAADFWARERVLEISTRSGEQRVLQLADNTIVHLNSDSAVAVEIDSKRRTIRMIRGQAYFEVAKDEAHRPFEVRAGDLLVRDVGTVFDVFQKPNGTIVTVVEGQVSLWDDVARRTKKAPIRSERKSAGAEIADLRAGDQAVVLPSGVVKTAAAVNVQQATAWIRQEIVFDHQPLGAVAAEFNRYNRTQVVVDPAVADIAISGVFHTYDVDAFGEFTAGIAGVSVTRSGDTIVVGGR